MREMAPIGEMAPGCAKQYEKEILKTPFAPGFVSRMITVFYSDNYEFANGEFDRLSDIQKPRGNIYEPNALFGAHLRRLISRPRVFSRALGYGAPAGGACTIGAS